MTRNILFSLFFFLGIIIISLIFLPSFFLPQKIVLFGGKLMGYWSAICLRIFLNVKILIKGKENIISNEKFFIASSHQSMFETFYLQTIFNSPVFILKNELLLIPIFGWYLKKIGSISIKRNKITKDNLGFIDDINQMIQTTNRPLIIFPQGTRALPEDRSDFKKGAGRIYEQINVPCQPIAINSGYVWPKKNQKIPNRTITISILKKIDQGLSKENFIQLIQKEIYEELDKIN
ncbi:lysophospholipid acyltransferase family protein [Candidatus Pelagibacter sp.]|uniref:lysophospholipid acyltransferase family protein n=1 Tax=Candidatus Pelagibacter sp. TaxID=2024849 RepID=UPI003F8635D4